MKNSEYDNGKRKHDYRHTTRVVRKETITWLSKTLDDC